MTKFARNLQSMPVIGFTFYDDDITIWATKESLAEKEEELEEATKSVENLAGHNELQCAPEKCEVIRISGTRYASPGQIIITLGDHTISEKDKIRILGMFIQSYGKANFTIER